MRTLLVHKGQFQNACILLIPVDCSLPAGGSPQRTACEPPSYRRGAKYMLNDSSLKAHQAVARQALSPDLVPGLTANAPDTILGYPCVINQAMQSPVAATNPTTMLFGDLQKFVIRKVKDMSVLRLNERYADFGQVGFIAFMRVDIRFTWTREPLQSLTRLLRNYL